MDLIPYRDIYISVADPGFPVGGGGVDLQRRCFSVKMYAKMKELGPIGGGVRPSRPPPDPPMHISTEDMRV